MNAGKRKCELLKSIRKEIAEKYKRRQNRFYSLAQNSHGLLVYSDFGAGLLYSDYSKKIEDFFGAY